MHRKLFTSAVLLLFTATFSFAQSYKLTWGEELKMKKGTTDLDIVAADNSGLYFSSGRVKLKSYYLIGASFSVTHKLLKMDKQFNELFEKEYKKELKGYMFNSFQMLDDDLFMFATDYDKKERNLKVYGVQIDKSSGDFLGDFAELGSYQLESRRDDYDVKLDTFNRGKNFLLVTDISNKDRNAIGVSVLDNKLHQKTSAIINLNYEKDAYSVQDVKYVNGKIFLLGKEFEHLVKNGRTKKRMVLKQFSLAVYNSKGKKEKDIDLGADNRFVIGGQMIIEPDGELLLAGFYSNQQKKNNLNGFFINKVDAASGELTLSSYKEINAGMLGTASRDDSDEDEDDKKQKKAVKRNKDDDDDDDADADEQLPNNFIIRTVDINPADMSYVITAEVSQHKSYMVSVPEYRNGITTWSNYNVHDFINKDILVINADQSAQIKWINIIPKYQLEEIRTSAPSGSGFYVDYTDYFVRNGNMPYYSSYTNLIKDNRLFIVLNDHESNNGNAVYKDKVKMIYNFKKKSNTYGISMDLTSGAVKRQFISENSSDLILMPRFAYILKNEIYIPSIRPRLLAKAEFKMAKITVM